MAWSVCMAPTGMASTHVRVLPFVLVPRIHFGKAERSGISPSRTCKLHFYMVELHIAIVYFNEYSSCYYLRVQLTYVDELYEECSGTACTCMNSEYQALLSDFC